MPRPGEDEGVRRIDSTDFRSSAEDDRATIRPGGLRLPILGWIPNLGRTLSLAVIVYLAAEQDPESTKRALQATRTLRKFEPTEIERLIERAAVLTTRLGKGRALERASRAFRGARGADAVFAVAANVALAGANTTDDNRRTITDVSLFLQLPVERARELVTVIIEKNRY